MTTWDHETDLLVIGSGAGAVGAMRASANGKRALVVEKESLFGGSTAMSGGVLWMPANPLMQREGIADSREDGLRYFESLVGDAGPASSQARRETYLDLGNEMLHFIQSEGVDLIRCPGMSDYYAGMRGIEAGSLEGRSLEPKVFNRKKLGAWSKKMRPGFSPGINIYTGEAAHLQAIRSTGGFRTAVKVGLRTAWGVVSGQKFVTNGEALQARVLHSLLQRQVPVWLDSPVTDLVVEDGRVIGAVVEKEGRTVRVRAHDGVLIAAGGFSRNAAMRQEFGRHVGRMTDEWTSANPGDTGEMIRAAMELGAATDMLDEAWWMLTWFDGDTPMMCMSERSKPHSMIVDASGQRFFNESMSYQQAGQELYRRERETGGALPAWLIIDSQHRNKYTFLMTPPGVTPGKWIKSGDWKKADTLEGLAAQCGIDAAGLRATADRFNAFARSGHDEDFFRGEGGFEQFYGDPDHGPNKCLGEIDKAPYYAIPLYPGDIGTSGGLMTDEHARVLREDGTPIEGLYATGNATASVMGRAYPGAGATIAASAVFGYAAAQHASAG